MIQLQNNKLIAHFNSKGAELCSLQNREGLEYIWQADPMVWPRHAPVLFPIVGRLKNDQYTYEDQPYALSQHGFARDREFTVGEKSETDVLFELTSDEASLNSYPFHFKLHIRYTLLENTLTTRYTVQNTGDKDLLFSIGAHPGFRCPLLPDENMEDYALEFTRDTLRRTMLSNGLLGSETHELALDARQLPLSHSLFDSDALVFANTQVESVSLRSKNHAHAVTLTCKDWPWFGIWSKKGPHPFVCLEPWMGITDSENSSGQLKEKSGILALAAAEAFSCSFGLTFL
jgi:galactose mutarotase-like enzyme